MEEVKILVFALVSFFSQENVPVAAKSAAIKIDVVNKQIELHQYDIYSLMDYKEEADKGLEVLMAARALYPDLSKLRLASNFFYEAEGKLNAIFYLQYDDLKDLRAISFYSDVDGNLSYPFIKEYEYRTTTGQIEGRYLRFDGGRDVAFTMQRKEYPFEGMYSMLEVWKTLEKRKYADVSETFSFEDFSRLRTFILKNGDRRTFRNLDNNNPYYAFEDVGVYLGTGNQNNINHSGKLDPKEYIEMTLWGDKQYQLFVIDPETNNKLTPSFLERGRVYFQNTSQLDSLRILEYLTMVKKQQQFKKGDQKN